jgi:hypothetical protein
MKQLLLIVFVLVSLPVLAQQDITRFKVYKAELWEFNKITEEWDTEHSSPNVNFDITLSKDNYLTVYAKNVQKYQLLISTEKKDVYDGKTSLRYNSINITDKNKECAVNITFDAPNKRVIFQIILLDFDPALALVYFSQMKID